MLRALGAIISPPPAAERDLRLLAQAIADCWWFRLHDPSALEELDKQHDDRHDQQHMNEIANNPKAETKGPKNQKYK